METIFLKVLGVLLVIALIILGVLVIFLATGALWAFIQEVVHDEWGFELPPRKDEWGNEWINTGKVTKDVVPQKIMKCGHCYYRTTVMSRCCPSCGKHMENWDPEWDWRKDGGLE